MYICPVINQLTKIKVMTKSQFLKAFKGVDYNTACDVRHYLNDLIVDLGKRAAAQVSCSKSGGRYYVLTHGDAKYLAVKEGGSYVLYVVRPNGSIGRKVFGKGTKNFWGVSHPSEFKFYIGVGILKK